MIETTLVWGGTAGAREAAIAAASAGQDGVAILIEGMPSGQVRLAGAVHIAPGCLCCAGQLVFQVSLNRLLRQGPRRLYLGLSSADTHIESLRTLLQSPPYAGRLRLSADLRCP